MEIEYWIEPHEHPLRLREDAINDQFSCQICDSSVKGALFYSCDSCNGFCVHKSCVELPYLIRHPFHSHLLTLIPKKSYWCSACFEDFEDAPSYRCGVCDFFFDLECALMPLVTSGREGQGWIQHFCHEHPLLRVDDDDQHLKCLVCSEIHLPLDLYGCFKCGYFLHKSCAELPNKVHLPLHRNHHDALSQTVVRGSFICGVCDIHMRGRYTFAYWCSQCSLYVCFKCAEVAWKSSGSLKYEDHDHLLCLVHNVKEISTSLPITPCDAYNSYCSQRIVTCCDEFKQMESFMLWCYQCGFRVHLLCAPLPSMVKHQFHIHSLILVDSMREDDSGEYYCDVCETKRDPLIRLYCCQDCKYFAHVHCLVPEILKLLSGDLKDVALEPVAQDLWNVPNGELNIEKVDSTLTLKDVINELSTDEKESIRYFYKWDETSSEDKNWKQEDRENIGSNKSFKVGDEEIDDILQRSHITYGSFKSFWSNLNDFYKNTNNKLELKASDLALKIVKVKGYMIPHSLAPVLNKLLHGYGDVDIAFTSRSLGFKSFVLFIACKMIKSMHTTMPMCITKSLLQEWFYHNQFARLSNFRVDFVHAQLKELIHAFLGFQAKRLEEEIPTMLTNKIDELQRKLDECNKIRGSSLKSKYMKFCVNKASELKCKMNAFGGSFDQNLDDVHNWSDED